MEKCAESSETITVWDSGDAELGGGWMVEEGGVPIGFISTTGQVITPSGAKYSIVAHDNKKVFQSEYGESVAAYTDGPGPRLEDASSNITWELRDDWLVSAVLELEDEGGRIILPAAFSRKYTLEDAQSVVPKRIKLLMAYEAALKWSPHSWTRTLVTGRSRHHIKRTTDENKNSST